MASHGLTAKYQPFSFSDYMAPIIALQERYDKVSDELATLGEGVSAWKGMVNPNSTAGKTLTQYEQLLEQTAQDFAANGLKSVSRNTLMNLKRMYNNQIAPIKTAAENYGTLLSQVRKEQAADPTLMVSGMPTVDELMANPSAQPYKLSGNTLEKEAYEIGKNIPDLRLVAGAAADLAAKYGVSNSQEAMSYISRGMQNGVYVQAKKAADEEKKFQERVYLKQLSSKRGGTGNSSSTKKDTEKFDTETYSPTGDAAFYGEDGSRQNGLSDTKIWHRQDSGDQIVSIDDLSPKEKATALRHAGVAVSEDAALSEPDLDALIEANRWKLEAYTYIRTKFDRLKMDNGDDLPKERKREGITMTKSVLEIRARSKNQVSRKVPRTKKEEAKKEDKPTNPSPAQAEEKEEDGIILPDEYKEEPESE